MSRLDLIQIRRDYAAAWTVVNPILDDGEPGYELDTGKMKIGDGASHWNAMPYNFDGEAITLSDVESAIGFSFGTLAARSSIAALDISDSSANARSLITAVNYAAMKVLLAIAAADITGLGTLATQNGTFSGTSSGTNTGDETAAGLLAKLITVDGSGSGLDADLLDGNSSAFFAPIASPALTGNPTAPNQTAGTNNTRIANTAYVDAAVAVLTAAVSGALIFKTSWDASAGTFPGAGVAQTGWFYKVSVAGTVDGISFSVGDDIYAVTNNASTTTYASNWLKIEGSITLGEVQAAVGFTFGALAAASSVTASLISDASANGRSLITAANYAAMKTLLAIANTDVSGLGTLATQSGTFSGTSSGTNTGDQLVFKTISVSGQSDVVADTATDTLTLVAGTNVTITTNATTDTITISASGGGGGAVADADYGDVVVSSTGTVWTVDANAVSNSKLADMATQTFKGRTTAGTGDPEDLTVAQAKTLLALTGTNSGDQTITLTGDVTGSGTGSFAATIANDAVTNAKLANVATATIKGRITAATGDPEDLTGTQATTLLDAFTSALKGLAPASGGGTANYLRADGTWAAPSASVTAGSGISVAGSTVSINTNNSVGVGAYVHATVASSTANGATVAGSSLTAADGATTLSGTWRNVSGCSINISVVGTWIRTV